MVQNDFRVWATLRFVRVKGCKGKAKSSVAFPATGAQQYMNSDELATLLFVLSL